MGSNTTKWMWTAPRKQACEEMLSAGRSNAEVAESFGCTEKDVAQYRASPKRKERQALPADRPAAPDVPEPAKPVAAVSLLHTLILDARNLCDEAWGKSNDADTAYAIGRLYEKLSLAIQLL